MRTAQSFFSRSTQKNVLKIPAQDMVLAPRLEELIGRHVLHHSGVDDDLENLSPFMVDGAAVAVVLEKTVTSSPR